MEKNLTLSDLRYQDLLQQIVEAVRNHAQTIPAFRDSHNGCIRITIEPLSQEAEAWLGGGLSDFSEADGADACIREFVFKINPKGSHTIQWTDPSDGHTEPVNCYGYSALKTAWASKAREWRSSGHSIEPELESGYYTEDKGWSTHDGSVCTTVLINNENFIRIYVCTSGAKSCEDMECSFEGVSKITFEYFQQYKDAVRFIM